MDINNLNAKDLLKITQPENLFSGKDFVVIKKEFRKLSLIWHPDKHVPENNPIFEEVFKHIKHLYEEAKKKYGVNSINKNYLNFKTLDGRDFKFKYQKSFNFELGALYLANEFVLYQIDNINCDLAESALKNLNSFQFRNKEMKLEMGKYIPSDVKMFEAENGIFVLFKKPKDVFLLSDVLNYFGGKLDAKSVAWILSSLYNTACFFEINKFTHNNLSLDTCFVSPANHYAMIIGGWWYSAPYNAKIVALPSESISVAPVDVLNNKRANFGLDLELIKHIGRSLLGDAIGSKLHLDKDVPKSLISWLRMPPLSNSAIKEYDIWQKNVLKESFGVRHFTKMDVSVGDIYKE